MNQGFSGIAPVLRDQAVLTRRSSTYQSLIVVLRASARRCQAVRGTIAASGVFPITDRWSDGCTGVQVPSE